MAGTLRSFHNLLERTEMIFFLHRLWIHLLDTGQKDIVAAYALKLLTVCVDSAGVLGKVFLIVELYGVDKDTDENDIVLLFGFAYQ